jgi:acyl-CoA synthetase (AMP-forming)/AMP-acid ligase II
MQAVSHYRGTLTWLPNFAYNFCARKIRAQHLDDVDLSSWRAIINCSEPMSWKSHQMFLERFCPNGLQPDALATSYAMAENVFAVTQGGIEEPVTIDEVEQDALQTEQVARPATCGQPTVSLLSAGRPIDNVRLRILNGGGEDLPERHIGEIALQSDCMLTGYYHRPDETTRAFLGDWYLTGDLGYVANGEVYITGRKKDLIIVGGKNVYPQDLEHLAMGVPGVHPGRAVAFGIFNETIGTEEVVIVAEVDETSSRARKRVAKEVYRTVARGAAVVPRHVHLVDPRWLIKTSSGKIARLANREKYLAEVGA